MITKTAFKSLLIGITCIVPTLLPIPIFAKAVVSVSFDDGAKSIYENGFPTFKKLHIPATIYVITDWIGTDEWYVDWKALKTLSRYGWEIGSHTVDHHSLIKLNNRQVMEELNESKKTLRDQGYSACSFASPYGEYNARVLNLIKKRYATNREAVGTSSKGLNDLKHFDRYNILSFELQNDVSLYQAKKKINAAIKKDKWLVFYLHEVVKGKAKRWQYNENRLRKLIDYIAVLRDRGKLAVKTIGDMACPVNF